MKQLLPMLLLSLSIVACNKSSGGSSSDCSTQAQDSASSTTCTLSSEAPLTGSTTGTTTGGTTGSTTGRSAGGTTGSTTGSTTGGTTGSTTGSSTGGTTGSTTGGSLGTALPNEAYTFNTNIAFINTTVDQQTKFEKAAEIIKKVVATEEFRDAVLNHTYNGVKTFVDNNGYTNAQIYQSILDAAEELQPTKNNAMDMEVELYTEASTTVGYTNTGTKRIWVNTKFFNTYDAAGVAHNLFHEWLHKIGYAHAVSYSVSRDYSVPYGIGTIMNTIGVKFL